MKRNKITCETQGVHLVGHGGWCIFCKMPMPPTSQEQKWDAFYNGIPSDVTRKLSIYDMHRIGKLIQEVWNVDGTQND